MTQVNKLKPLTIFATGAGIIAATVIGLNFISPNPTVHHLDAEEMRLLTDRGTFQTIQGAGARTIHVFISADCKYCREIEPELDQLDNVTVYRHILPGRSKKGHMAAAALWCSDDRVMAWKKIVAGREVSSPACGSTVLDENLALAKRLRLTTTPSIAYEDGSVSAGLLSSSDIGKNIAKSSTR